MGENTKIGWCDHTHNEWIGCLKVSPACASCYAEFSTPTRVLRAKGLEVWGPAKTATRHRTSAANRRKPFLWDRAAKAEGVRRRVFCSSLSDVFEDHPMLDAWRADLWRTIEACDGLDWQLLTKRPENIMRMVPAHWHTAWPAHVWIGTTVEDQQRAKERIPHLLRVPARVRFLSCEPLLERIDLGPWIGTLDCRSGPHHWRGFDADGCDVGHRDECAEDETACEGENGHCPVCGSAYHVGPIEPREEFGDGDWRDVHSSGRTLHPIDWVIVGGESGPGARPFDLVWARSIVAQCREAGLPVFVKQIGDNPVLSPGPITWPSTVRAGTDPAEWPEDLRVQQFPGADGP